MLTQSEITRFYRALGVERQKDSLDEYWPLDANEVERLMPKIAEKCGWFEMIPPHQHGSSWQVTNTRLFILGNTIAEAVARWVLAQESYFNEDDRPGRSL